MHLDSDFILGLLHHPANYVKKSAMILLFCCPQSGAFPRARAADSSSWNFILWESLTAASICSFTDLSWFTSVCLCRPDYPTPEDSLQMKFTHGVGGGEEAHYGSLAKTLDFLFLLLYWFSTPTVKLQARKRLWHFPLVHLRWEVKLLRFLNSPLGHTLTKQALLTLPLPPSLLRKARAMLKWICLLLYVFFFFLNKLPFSNKTDIRWLSLKNQQKTKIPHQFPLGAKGKLDFAFSDRQQHPLLPRTRLAWSPALPTRAGARWQSPIPPSLGATTFRKPVRTSRAQPGLRAAGYAVYPHTKQQGNEILPARLLMTSMNPSPAASSRVCSRPLGWAIATHHVSRLPHAPNFGRQVGPRRPPDALQSR